jgi:hypothetical protein
MCVGIQWEMLTLPRFFCLSGCPALAKQASSDAHAHLKCVEIQWEMQPLPAFFLLPGCVSLAEQPSPDAHAHVKVWRSNGKCHRCLGPFFVRVPGPGKTSELRCACASEMCGDPMANATAAWGIFLPGCLALAKQASPDTHAYVKVWRSNGKCDGCLGHFFVRGPGPGKLAKPRCACKQCAPRNHIPAHIVPSRHPHWNTTCVLKEMSAPPTFLPQMRSPSAHQGMEAGRVRKARGPRIKTQPTQK